MESEFENWLSTEKVGAESESCLEWRRQFFDWWLRWEECDTGCDSLRRQSAVAWGQYIDYECDTSLANGFYSVLDVLERSARDGQVDVRLAHAVEVREQSRLVNGNVTPRQLPQKIDYSSPAATIVHCSNGATFSCRLALITVSLGCLKADDAIVFMPELPTEKVESIKAVEFGTINRVKLDFEWPFWDKKNPGYMILWKDEGRNEEKVTRQNWTRHVVGFDEVVQQPNMLMAWVSGEAARYLLL